MGNSPRSVPASCSPDGIENTRADLLSRQWSRHHSFEWQLHPSVFSAAAEQMPSFFPEVDLFASASNRQLHLLCSLQPHESVWRVNALTFLWGGWGGGGMCFTHSHLQVLIPRIGPRRDLLASPGCSLLAVQTLVPEAGVVSSGRPFRLPLLPDLLSLPEMGVLHPKPQSLFLTGGFFGGGCPYMASQGWRPSTLNLYDRRLRLFGEWCVDRSLCHLKLL